MLRTIRKDALEATVMGALRQRMMVPEIYHTFAQEFTAEWNRLQAEASGNQAAKQAELDRIRQQLERLVDAMANGTPIGALHSRLGTLEARRIALAAELAMQRRPPPFSTPTWPTFIAIELRSLPLHWTLATARTPVSTSAASWRA